MADHSCQFAWRTEAANWTPKPDNPEAVAQLFDCNDVVKVRGAIEHYSDKPQLIVSRIRRCEAKEYTAADFYPASNRDPEEMFGELETFVAMGAR